MRRPDCLSIAPKSLRRTGRGKVRIVKRVACQLAFFAITLLCVAPRFASLAHAGDEEELKKYWRYFEMSVAFEAEGQELEARAVLGCQPYFSKRLSGTRVQYDLPVPWVAKRLPSGAGLLFPAPGGICTWHTYNDRATGELRLSAPIPSSFVPVAFWLDNADNPQAIEEYVSDTYYRRPSPRLRIRGVSVVPVSSGPVTNAADAVRWLAADPLRGLFVGFYSTLVPKSVWSGVPEVATVIRGLVPGQNLTPKQHIEISRFIQAWVKGADVYSRAFGIPIEGQRLPSGYTEETYIASQRVHPIVLKDGRYELDESQTGIIFFYPRPARTLAEDTAELRSLTFELLGHSVTIPTTLWQFDARSESLLEVEAGAFRPCSGCSVLPKATQPTPTR